jgi:hypothetical protein
MTEPPRCGCGCSISKDQLAKLLTLLSFLGTDVLYSLLVSTLFHSEFQFPLYLGMFHALLAFVLALLILRTEVEGRVLPRFQHLTANWENALQLTSQGLACALDVGLLTLSLLYSSNVTHVLLIRATIPLFTALLSSIVHRHQRKAIVWLCVTGVTAGGVLSLFQNDLILSELLQHSELLSMGLALGSVVMNSLVLVLAEFIMVKSDLDALNLLFYSSLPTAFFLFPFFVVREAAAVLHYLNDHFWFNLIIVCSSSILAFALAVSRYQLVRLTSSVYSSSVPNLRLVVVLLATEIVAGGEEKLSLLQQAGLVLCALCFLYLSFLGFSEDGYQLPSYSDRVLYFGRQLRGLLRKFQRPSLAGATSHHSANSIEFELLENTEDTYVDEKERRFTIGEISDDEEEEEEESTHEMHVPAPSRDKGKAEALDEEEQTIFYVPHYQNGDDDDEDEITPYEQSHSTSV